MNSTTSHELAAEPIDPTELVEERLVLWYFLAAIVSISISLLGGLLMSMQLIHWNPHDGVEYLSPGRWRMIHTNAIAYGFIANSFLGALHWAIPRLTLKKVLCRRLSYFIFAAWQVVVLSTVAGILMGHAQGVEWGETPVWIDPLAQVGLFLVAINFLTPIIRAKGPLYVSLWYFMAAFVWTFLTYAMGNFMPQYYVSGTSAGAITGLFIHDLVGLFVTPLAWGLMYYFVPILLQKPIWSHGLSLVGFWGLAFFYPLNGIHHFLLSPIPMFLQYSAIVATVAVEFVVLTVIINFFGTLWGSSRALVTNIPLRWFYTGMVCYFLTCLQCSMQVTISFQKVIHFSDWVVGHAHLVMFGVFGLWFFGMMTYLFPRLLRHPWYSRNLCEWHYWLTAVGIFVMASDLILAGLFQGYYWVSLQPWDASVNGSQPFWIVRFVAGVAIISGQICFFVNLWKTWRLARASDVESLLPNTTYGPAWTAE
ncbi:MAG: cbb3-type cytochrome c oxidase subunit I [Pirellulales bacterium]|nr:cbb3-type cytochrome c oxidase subunit I [Pirellulales bacterium]